MIYVFFKSHEIIQTFSTLLFEEKLNQNHNNKITSGWAQNLEGQEVDKGWASPWNWYRGGIYPPCASLHQGTHYKGMVASRWQRLNHPRNNWVTARPPLSEDLAYCLNWSHLDYPSLETTWLRLGCGSGLEHFPSPHSLCTSAHPALQGKEMYSNPVTRPEDFSINNFWTPGPLLSTRAPKNKKSKEWHVMVS